MRDWKGLEGIFHRGELPVEDLLELSEPHFTFRPTPAPELHFFLSRTIREEIDRISFRLARLQA